MRVQFTRPLFGRVTLPCEECGVLFGAPISHVSRRYCSWACYSRGRVATTLLARITERTDFDGPLPMHAPWLGQCEVWTGTRRPDGRGVIKHGGRRGPVELVYRVAYRLLVGSIPAGLMVLHACDNPQCLRPDHLFLGRMRDNARDRDAKGRTRHYTARGERNHHAKLTDAQNAALIVRGLAGERVRFLAQEYGVSIATVHRKVSRARQPMGIFQSKKAVGL